MGEEGNTTQLGRDRKLQGGDALEGNNSLDSEKLLRMFTHCRWDSGTIITSRESKMVSRDKNMTKSG